MAKEGGGDPRGLLGLGKARTGRDRIWRAWDGNSMFHCLENAICVRLASKCELLGDITEPVDQHQYVELNGYEDHADTTHQGIRSPLIWCSRLR